MDLKYILKLFIYVFLIFSLIVFVNSIGLNLNPDDQTKQLTTVIEMEAFQDFNPAKAFCETNKGADLEKSCNGLTKNNCGKTSCCIWTNENKCVAGGASGALFNSDANGKTKQLDYYFYEGKCYGDKCSS